MLDRRSQAVREVLKPGQFLKQVNMGAEPWISSRSLGVGCVDPTGKGSAARGAANGLFAPLMVLEAGQFFKQVNMTAEPRISSGSLRIRCVDPTGRSIRRAWALRTADRDDNLQHYPQAHKKAFGRAINPYLFRGTAATTLAIADPTNVRGRLRSGHRIFTTTERYYQRAQSFDAHRACGTALYAKGKRP
jgi:hypothetical protein